MNTLVGHAQSWMIAYLINSLWQVPLLAGAGWVAARLMRRAGPEAEHRIWVAVLLLQVLLPAIAAAPLPWIGRGWILFGSAPSSLHGGITVEMGGGSVVGGVPFSGGLLTSLALAYALSLAWFAVRFLVRCVRLMRLWRGAAEFSPIGEAAQTLNRSAALFGIRQPVKLALSEDVYGPVALGGAVTLGLRHKAVLLPAGMLTALPIGDLETVMAHECAHIARNDFGKNLLYELLSLPALYHPLFRFTRQRITETREMVCDGMAARPAGQAAYANSLLRLAALLVKGVPARTPHAIGIFDANTFERRIMRLARMNTEVRGMRRVAQVALCTVLGVATCGTAVAVGLRVDDDAAKPATARAKNAHNVSVSAAVMQNNVLTKVPPLYPQEAKQAGIQGVVVLSAEIGEDGSVEALKVISGPKELQQSALDAVRQWKYKPYQLHGKAVAVDTTINVTYSLAR